MDEIILNSIWKKENAIVYDFSVSDGLKTFFSGKQFVIEYPENVESVPDAVAAVPFMCNVLPIIWLTNSRLIVKEVDRDFFDCIENVRKGYKVMFPESIFAGEVCAGNIVAHENATNGSAVFFSGGLDATQTLLSHVEEKPDLIAIWGADVHYDNIEGWSVVEKGLFEAAQNYHQKIAVIHSTFRTFDNESLLDDTFHDQLKDGWWHGVKHGIGLLGHAAPYAYLKGLSTIYIASSHCPADGHVRCASNPLTDNHVRFANCRIVHDGFELSRQDKIKRVVLSAQNTNQKIALHVCWESQEGTNCCNCEKCFRTMVGIWLEGADPKDYGFDYREDIFDRIYQYIGLYSHAFSPIYWNRLKDTLKCHWEELGGLDCRDKLAWMLDFDFDNVDNNPCRKKLRIVAAKTKIANRFPRLYAIYARIKKK